MVTLPTDPTCRVHQHRDPSRHVRCLHVTLLSLTYIINPLVPMFFLALYFKIFLARCYKKSYKKAALIMNKTMAYGIS